MMTWKELHELYQMPRLPLEEEELRPNYNGAPTQHFAVVVTDPTSGERSGRLLRWGLLPGWANDTTIASRMINARSETVSQKPAFRAAFKSRRCIVPASGFFEWEEVPGHTKGQPNYVHRSDGLPLSFAGLWEHNDRAGPQPLDTFTILTTDANAFMGMIHHRMPVVLDKAGWEAWLDPQSEPISLLPLLASREWQGVSRYPVSQVVNSVRNNAPVCIAPIG